MVMLNSWLDSWANLIKKVLPEMRDDTPEEAAIALAQEVVIWLAGHDDLLPVFLNATGSDADSVRKGVQNPDFLGSVLDFLLLDDAWVRAFCDAAGRDYADPRAARRALPGGAEVHWT